MSQMELIDATTPVELGVADEVIGELRKRLTGRKADTHAGYEMVLAGIAEVTKYRTGVDRAGKELKASHIAYQKKVNAEVHRVKDLLLEIETPLRAEKARIDDEAERQRKENEEEERLAIEAIELAKQEERDAEEAAQREEDRKERDAEAASLAEERRVLDVDRKRLEVERREQQDATAKQQRALEAEREEIEATRQAAVDKHRREREAKEALALVQVEKAERARSAEAEKVRLAEEEAERERLAEERKPDVEKLKDFARGIEAIEPPQLNTSWGNARLAVICDHLQSACDAAYCEDAATEDELVAADAAETVTEQSPNA